MDEELVREGTEPGVEGEEMIVVFKIGPWNAEKGLPCDKLKDKAAKTPDVKGFVDHTSKNQLRSSKTTRHNGLCWRIRKEICCQV